MFIPKEYKTEVLRNKELYQLFLNNREALSKLVTSNYDITKKCNLSCDGCYFFEGDDYMSHSDNASIEEWEAFFQKEKERGVNFPYIAGAEPSLVQDRLLLANKYFDKGVIFTNGSTKIDENINFKIHISVWGEPESEEIIRKDSFFLKALKMYQNDKRALFIFTINALNIDEMDSVIKHCQEWNAKLTFNLFSPTTDYLKTVDRSKSSSLILKKIDLEKIREKLNNYIDIYADTLIYTKDYNNWVSNPNGLYIIDSNTSIAEDCAVRSQKNNLHFRTDFSFSESKCCFPNVDCTHCRAYAVSVGSAIARYNHFFKTYDGFLQWNNIVKQWREMFSQSF